MKITGKKHLDRGHLGVDPDLALECHRDTEGLSWVRHTDIGLELDGIFETALDEVGAAQGVFQDDDTAVLEIALGCTDALILVTELCEKARFNVAL
jgi:hypothetical protein